MSHDFFCLKVLIVSDSAPECEQIRRAASQCSTPMEIAEVEKPHDVSSARVAFRGNIFDVVLLDSEVPRPALQAMFEGARASQGNPLAIFVGPADPGARSVLTDGLAFDGGLWKPIDQRQATALFESCARARGQSSVLIVDDSSTVRSVIHKVIQASRFRLGVEEAGDGKSAIEMAARRRFDLVFLDCNMPGIDGFAVLEAIKVIDPNCKIVMITGIRDIRIEERARENGAAGFLYKPFFAKDIDAVLNRLFGLTQSL